MSSKSPINGAGLQALIFDVDGTLADTERDGHRLAYNAAFREFGLDWDWDPALYGRLLAVHGGKERLHHYVQHYRPDFALDRDLEMYIDELHAVKTEHFVKIVRQRGIPARPGIKRLLQEARAEGLRLAIATTTSRINVEALLQTAVHANAPDWFEVIGAGEDASDKKPAPDIYELVLQRLKLSAGHVLAFEDSRNGLLSATGAGIRTVITVNDYTEYEDFHEAILVIDHLGEPDCGFRLLASVTPMQGHAYVNVDCLRFLHAKT